MLNLHTQSFKIIFAIVIINFFFRSHDYICFIIFPKKFIQSPFARTDKNEKSQYFLMKCSFCIVGLRDRLKVYLNFFKNDM